MMGLGVDSGGGGDRTDCFIAHPVFSPQPVRTQSAEPGCSAGSTSPQVFPVDRWAGHTHRDWFSSVLPRYKNCVRTAGGCQNVISRWPHPSALVRSSYGTPSRVYLSPRAPLVPPLSQFVRSTTLLRPPLHLRPPRSLKHLPPSYVTLSPYRPLPVRSPRPV
ncbi:uncharacterized protein LOC118561188 isoform X2 [Fundulus heteroclitus]|nr:uncharacterized protein LOC118561188 isoform X2 [Fundulus heteroclitus]